MLNPGYNKTQLKDAHGNLLLPHTTASMVSEEPDRRFVDNVEKTLLFTLSDNQVQLEGLSEKYAELIILAENADTLLPGSEQQQALATIMENIESLAVITEQLQTLLGLATGHLTVISETSDNVYNLTVDDTDLDNPQLVLTKIEETETP